MTATKKQTLSKTQEFHLRRYREILVNGINSGYRFINFETTSKSAKNQCYCILRHDIDYMPEWCLQMSNVENELKIKSTWFFQTCAKTYNLRESENYAIVRKLHKEGHTLGVHIDLSWNPKMELSKVSKFIHKEKKLFEKITGVKPCDIVSFHNAQRFTDRIINKYIAGVHHSYEPRYFSEIKYLSDSQGWYEGCASLILAEKKYSKLQLLIHPYIWPERNQGGFIENMGAILRRRQNELFEYMIKYHPVCTKNAEKLKTEI